MTISTRLRHLAVLLPLLWGNHVQADEGIPALLQFAEQYQSRQTDTIEKTLAVTPPAPKLSDSPTLRQALKERNAQLAKQQATLRQQENEMLALRQALEAEARRYQQLQAESEKASSQIDWVPLQGLVGALRQAVNGHPGEQRALALIEQARAATEREKTELAESQALVLALKRQLHEGGQQTQQALALQQQLDEKAVAQARLQQQLEAAQAQQTELSSQLKTLQAERLASQAALNTDQEKEKAAWERQLAAKQQQLAGQESAAQEAQVALAAQQHENQALQKQLATVQQQASAAEAGLAKQTQTLQQLQTDMDVLRARAKWLVKPETLSKPEGQQAYAAGGALGRDILAMLNERKGWGVNTDRQTLLAGVVDAFAGQYQLTTDVLARALADSEDAVNKAREKAVTAQHQQGESYVADFQKQKGVKQSPSGFWYRVDYAGDTPLHDTDIVDVVVKETLTDGTVIQDMALSGNVLSQPINAFPPLFREAMGHLRNHGSLTMVVPPALAYGAEGYPPKVPPNATMVYELRIDNSAAAPGGEGGKPVIGQPR